MHPTPCPREEARAWARLASEVVDRTVARPVHHVHRAVSGRVFAVIGPIGRPVRLIHDAIAEGVHATVRGSFRGVGFAAGAVAAHRARAHELPWHERSPLGSRLAAIAHGLLGDLADLAPPLDLPLVIREEGRTVPAEPDPVREAFPTATDRIVVFVHGLVQDERVWEVASSRVDRVSLPTSLAAEGFTPIRVRYGSGAPIGRNGSALADLLEHLMAVWPVPVARLALVGHSMGGLVIRSACGHAQERGHRWAARLEHIAYLASPHLGAPLEQLVHRATTRAAGIPELAPFIDVLERRSPGIRDLRHGTFRERVDELVDEATPPADEPWMEGVDHHLFVGRLTATERHPVNRLFGDLLVPAPSALGRSRSRGRRIDGDRVHVQTVAANHFALCWHPAVADHLRTHLRSDRDAA